MEMHLQPQKIIKMKKLQILRNKCKKITLVITDVDGVLTDGGMYYGKEGELMKKFNTKDGMGVELLNLNKIMTVLLTKENSIIVIKRGKKVKAAATYINIQNKLLMLDKISKKFKIKKENIAYIGDDINDLEIMKSVGMSACPNDAVSVIRQNSDYVCDKRGGDGAFREFADLILSFSD